MALVIPRSKISRPQEETIVKMLTIQPQDKGVFSKSKYAISSKESFYFFVSTPDTLRLPYAFGKILLGPPNPKEYPEIPEERRQINGQLRPRQLKKVNKLDLLLDKNQTAVFCAHTGFGKTRIANHYIIKFKFRNLILVPGIQLMIQWEKAVREILPKVTIGTVGESYLNDQDYDVLICMPERWHLIPEVVRDTIGFMIIDEAHMFCTPTRSVSLLQFSPKYVLALTASPRRRDQTMGVIDSLCGINHVKAKYRTPVLVWEFISDLLFPTKKNVRGQTDWASTLKSIIENEEYNATIVEITKYVISLGRKPLLMCERKYHVQDLYSRIKAEGLSADFLMEDKNEYSDSQCLLAIMKKAGTGFDEQYACPDFKGGRIDTVIYCSSFRELNGLIQYGGRAFRAENPLIIHLVVKNPIIENHWREASKYYRSGEYLKTVTIEKVNCSLYSK